MTNLRPARDVAEIAFDQRPGVREVDIACQHQHGIVRAVMRAKPVAHRVEIGGVQIRHRSDGAVVIRMPVGKQRIACDIGADPERLVVALALFVLDDAALGIELHLIDGTEQMPHTVAFEEQDTVECGGRHRFEIVRPLERGGAVRLGRADRFQPVEKSSRRVFRTVEHQMFEQVRKAFLALRLVARPDVIPDRDRDDGGLAVGMDDDAQAVGQGELVERNIDRLHQRRQRHRVGGDGRVSGNTGAKEGKSNQHRPQPHRHILA